MQKLLSPALAGAIPERGSFTLGGPVVRAVDVADLSAQELALAHGWVGPGLPWETAPEQVDVLRFESNVLMEFVVPGEVDPRPWPTYGLGFLLRGAVPMWLLTRTRVPFGTEYRRIDAAGGQRTLSTYGGASLGWEGTGAFRPPLGLTGPRAIWSGVELPCLFTGDHRSVELIALGEHAPEGFETPRPQVHRRVVPLEACERVFELDLRASWRGARVRVVQVAGERAQVDLIDPDPDAVARLAAVSLEPGGFEAVAPKAELSDTAGRTRELPPTAA